MNYITYLLAFRYVFATSFTKSIAWMSRICFLGIFIGSFALALVHAIMHGYEQEIHKKMQGIHAQLIIHDHGQDLNAPAISAYVSKNIPEIAAISPVITQYGLVHTECHDSMPTLVMLKAIDPERERLTSTIEEKIISFRESPLLTHCIHHDGVLIGSALAQQLNVTVGDAIEFIYSQDTQTRTKKLVMESYKLTIEGIFKTGIDEFDSGAIFCSYSVMQRLFPEEGISHINIKLAPRTDEQQVIQQIQQDLNLTAYSWKELYPALVSALKLEKYAMFFILLLITLVASLNIISLLFMLITQKRPDIALLYTLGAHPSMVMRIFMCIGTGIAAIASICGIFCAWITCRILEKYPFVQLPDAYYVTQLPAIIDWPLVLMVFCAIMSISTLATWFIARSTRYINIADVLRFEG